MAMFLSIPPLSGVFSKTIYPILTTLYQLMYYVLMDNILKEKSL